MFDEFLISSKRLSNPKYLEELVIKAAKPFAPEMIDFNTDQLSKGKLSTGKKITPDYSNEYAKFKGFKTPDLKLEGEYYSGKYIEFKNTSFLMGSNDEKADKLENKYSLDIDGLTDSNLNESGELIADDFIKEITNEFIK